MKILPGVGWGDARGSIGAVTYSRNRGGAYAKTKVTPVNPVSSYSAAVRASLAFLAAQWRTLSQGVQQTWTDFAQLNPRTNVFGNPITLTGEQMYISVNQRLEVLGQTLLTSPPANLDVESPGTVGTFTFDTDPAFAITVTMSGATGGEFEVWMTPPLSPGIANFRKYLRFLTYTEDFSGLAALYTARFGTPTLAQAGNLAGLQVKAVNTTNGAASPPVFGTAIIT